MRSRSLRRLAPLRLTLRVIASFRRLEFLSRRLLPTRRGRLLSSCWDGSMAIR